MVVITNATKLVKPCDAREEFALGLACDNVEKASTLIGTGKATLKVSVYPWGAEFDIIESGAADEGQEENHDAAL